MSELLLNHLGGRWQAGTGAGTALFDPVLGNELVRVDATGLDLAGGFAFARQQGGDGGGFLGCGLEQVDPDGAVERAACGQGDKAALGFGKGGKHRAPLRLRAQVSAERGRGKA